jgi:D-glycero-D-manno-heptose 1,7-bisphosphate phosphatase
MQGGRRPAHHHAVAGVPVPRPALVSRASGDEALARPAIGLDESGGPPLWSDDLGDVIEVVPRHQVRAVTAARKSMSQRAVFLDKDGTLIDDVPYNVDPALIRLAEGVAEGLRALHAAGYRLIVVSNQSGVARGLFPIEALEGVERRLRELLAQVGVPLAGFYYCPHHPEGVAPDYAVACDCRKPEPGLVLRAARDHGVDPGRSWFIGDILDDVEAGRRAGCQTILIDNGHETEWRASPWRLPHHMAADFAQAASLVTDPSPPDRD